ncbi:MAG: TIGR00730 family Rossman fold protein [Paludibacter sp.]
MQNICVYCASSTQVDKLYLESAAELGRVLVENGMNLVYGAGSVGLMGALADSVMLHGGKVTGVIPAFMCEQEWDHKGITELIITETMHERKEKMAFMSDAAIALPGGCGTLEELLEVITWKQLGLYLHPIIIVNINGYYNPLIEMLQKAIDQRFMREIHGAIWTVVDEVAGVIHAINNAEKWDKSIRKLAAL